MSLTSTGIEADELDRLGFEVGDELLVLVLVEEELAAAASSGIGARVGARVEAALFSRCRMNSVTQSVRSGPHAAIPMPAVVVVDVGTEGESGTASCGDGESISFESILAAALLLPLLLPVPVPPPPPPPPLMWSYGCAVGDCGPIVIGGRRARSVLRGHVAPSAPLVSALDIG